MQTRYSSRSGSRASTCSRTRASDSRASTGEGIGSAPRSPRWALEGLVQVVPLAPQQPELLEVADVGEIPDERRLERRVLRRQLLVGDAGEQALGSLARADELE